MIGVINFWSRNGLIFLSRYIFMSQIIVLFDNLTDGIMCKTVFSGFNLLGILFVCWQGIRRFAAILCGTFGEYSSI